MGIIFDKGDTLELTLAHDKFDLNKVTMLAEMVSQSVFVDIVRKRFDEKLGLIRVLRIGLSDRLSFDLFLHFDVGVLSLG